MRPTLTMKIRGAVHSGRTPAGASADTLHSSNQVLKHVHWRPSYCYATSLSGKHQNQQLKSWLRRRQDRAGRQLRAGSLMVHTVVAHVGRRRACNTGLGRAAM